MIEGGYNIDLLGGFWRALAPPRHVSWVRLRSAKRPEPLIRRVADQGFQTQSDSIGIRGSPACLFRLVEKLVIDVEGLLHAGIYTI